MQFSKPKLSMELSFLSADRPASRRRPGGEGGSIDVPEYDVWSWCFDLSSKIPKVGGVEKLKLHEAIPPFSLIEDSIHGR